MVIDVRDFRVQPETIAGAAPMFDGVAHEVRTAVAKLRATLDGLGDFWGDDEQGARFAEGYRPHAATVQTAADNIAVGLASIADALEAQADNHQRTDKAIASRLSIRPR
jgi:uncharacterized protein YukE